MEKLQHIRQKINHIDEKILELLEERLRLAQEAFLEKEKQNIPLFQPQREKDIIENIQKKVNPLHQKEMDKIFKEIIAFCREHQSL